MTSQRQKKSSSEFRDRSKRDITATTTMARTTEEEVAIEEVIEVTTRIGITEAGTKEEEEVVIRNHQSTSSSMIKREAANHRLILPSQISFQRRQTK